MCVNGLLCWIDDYPVGLKHHMLSWLHVGSQDEIANIRKPKWTDRR